jgi:hypothetical protein
VEAAEHKDEVDYLCLLKLDCGLFFLWGGIRGGLVFAEWLEMMSLNELPMTFYPKRGSALLLFLGSGAFVAAGIWIGMSGESVGYWGAVFFGLGVVVGVVQMIPGSSYLKLTRDGFEFSAMFRRHFVLWSDVSEFGVMTIRQGGLAVNRMVGFNYSVPAKGVSGRALSRAVAGFEGGLPDCYGHRAEVLAEMMTRLRAEACGRT